jgi:hypothetical protein
MRKPDFDSFADPYQYTAALLAFEHAAYVEAIREAMRTCHQPARWEVALNVAAAVAEARIPFLWCPRCACAQTRADALALEICREVGRETGVRRWW